MPYFDGFLKMSFQCTVPQSDINGQNPNYLTQEFSYYPAAEHSILETTGLKGNQNSNFNIVSNYVTVVRQAWSDKMGVLVLDEF